MSPWLHRHDRAGDHVAARRGDQSLFHAYRPSGNGRRCWLQRKLVQHRLAEAWMVWIFSPPGVSGASANRRRARCKSRRPGGAVR